VLISTAYAQTATGGMEAQLMSFLPIILMFVVLWFLMIRPQMKRAKEHKSMVESLKKGDEVVAAGGLVGKISKVGDVYLSLEVARAGEDSVDVKVEKVAVQKLLPNGTIKAI
jgi:preprotein translocase subunit YajC